MINTQLKLIFVDIPKTGSTALKTFLIRGFHNFVWQPTSNPAWIISSCPESDRYTISTQGKVERNLFTRHEPLLSKYIHLGGIEKYFIFTVVRDPFERFKSSFIEAILHNRHRIKQNSASMPNKYSNQNLHDPWYIYPYYGMNNYFGVESSEDLQAKLIFNQLNIILAKGGFEKTGVCNIPIHFWPQYYFTSLTTASPLNIVYIKHENLEKDFPVLREELSYITGVDVTKEELPFAEPTANVIFGTHNFKAINTMGYKFELEKEIPTTQPSEFDIAFPLKYPTFDDYLPAFKQEKQEVTEHWLPILEQHRGLIEHLYAEDYRLYGYNTKS